MGHKRSSQTEPLQVGKHNRQRPKHKKRKHRQLFRLEDLPTEILEMIFEYSGNFNLPLVSSVLAAQLSGKRLQECLMSQVLSPVLLDLRVHPSTDQLARFEDLLSRRFCTWVVFRDWLKLNALHFHGAVQIRSNSRAVPYPHLPLGTGSPMRLKLQQDCNLRAMRADMLLLSEYKLGMAEAVRTEHWQAVMRLLLEGRITAPVLIPGKLLHGPWTTDRIAFLQCLQYSAITSLFVDTEHGARVASFDGIADAIKDGQPDAIEVLYSLGAEPDSDALRHAVVEIGCEERMIDVLLNCYYQSRCRRWCFGHKVEPFDALDSSLWQWAEQREQVRSGHGSRLKLKLNDYMEKCLEWDSLEAQESSRPRLGHVDKGAGSSAWPRANTGMH